jgi:plasmid stabilization system protein ParE
MQRQDRLDTEGHALAAMDPDARAAYLRELPEDLAALSELNMLGRMQTQAH